MEFTTVQHLTRNEYIRLCFYLTYRQWWVILLTIFFILLGINYIIEKVPHSGGFAWLILPFICLCIIPVRTWWSARSAYNKYAVLQHPVTYSFHESGYDISGSKTEKSVQWSQVFYLTTGAGFMVLDAGTKGSAILKVASLTSDQKAFIRDMFLSRPLPHLQGIDRNGRIRKNRPPYELSWLGLVPVVGAIAGAILLFKSVFYYKDKKMGLIAIAAMLPTAFLYSLPLIVKQIPTAVSGFRVHSSMQLKSTVRAIEFYRLQYGQYPDSLPALLQDDPLVPIHDPVQISSKEKNTLFEYHRYGDKYTVYSRGEDGKAGTADDLFPKVTIYDSTIVGLIRERER